MGEYRCLVHQTRHWRFRVECAIKPFDGRQGQWLMIYAAGLEGGRPLLIETRGPYFGRSKAQREVAQFVTGLQQRGYEELQVMPLWSLPIQAASRQASKNQR